jgi:hypothetical protein
VTCDRNNDGVRDRDDPGIAGVNVDLVCAGPDGRFGTDDDIFRTQVTDENGMYLFSDVAPGLCEIAVDTTSAPPRNGAGQCPTELKVDLIPSQSFLDVDFCFTLNAIARAIIDEETIENDIEARRNKK